MASNTPEENYISLLPADQANRQYYINDQNDTLLLMKAAQKARSARNDTYTENAYRFCELFSVKVPRRVFNVEQVPVHLRELENVVEMYRDLFIWESLALHAYFLLKGGKVVPTGPERGRFLRTVDLVICTGLVDRGDLSDQEIIPVRVEVDPNDFSPI